MSESMKPIILDVEASGLGRGSYPVEAGFVLADGKSHCAIIRRESEWEYWDPQAERLHGISRQTLDHYGKTPMEVAAMLNHYLAGQTVYSDAWGNDSSWIALLFDVAELPQRFKLESLRSLLSDSQLEIWHDTKAKVVKELGFRRHRASHDALILQHTFYQTARCVERKRAC
ncbi:hypothetical protein [Oceanicoccus sp. KOV_DT_Chl]|uniref:hypothetical protein n=1 Tax=Oceanicoccus sp. KOV_DT_Chl TaxID=1904639 RepID=UPI000C7CB91D|nr:hypothetical protein [Oceanicoccus sp. KOV_DT_Chl]